MLQDPFCGISSWGHHHASQIPPETFLIKTPDFSARLCKDMPKAQPILTPSVCRRAKKSNCSQKTGKEQGPPPNYRGIMNYGASKGNQETLPLLSLSPASRHIFDTPHRTSPSEQILTAPASPQNNTAITSNRLPLFCRLDVSDSQSTRAFRHIGLGWLPSAAAIPLSPHTSYSIATSTI